MLIKYPDILKIKNVVFNINGNSALGPDGFGGDSYHSCCGTIEKDVCNVVQQFFKQNWVLPGMNSNVVSRIPKIQGDGSIKDYRSIVVLISNLRLFPRYWWIGLHLWLLESFLLINMGLCRVDRFRIALVLLFNLLTCFLKRLKEVMWLTKLIFIKPLTL